MLPEVTDRSSATSITGYVQSGRSLSVLMLPSTCQQKYLVRVYPTQNIKTKIYQSMQSGRSLSVLILPYMPKQYPVSELSVSIGTAEYKVAGVRLPMIQHLHPD